jgi:hypothetical protein
MKLLPSSRCAIRPMPARACLIDSGKRRQLLSLRKKRRRVGRRSRVNRRPTRRRLPRAAHEPRGGMSSDETGLAAASPGLSPRRHRRNWRERDDRPFRWNRRAAGVAGDSSVVSGDGGAGAGTAGDGPNGSRSSRPHLYHELLLERSGGCRSGPDRAAACAFVCRGLPGCYAEGMKTQSPAYRCCTGDFAGDRTGYGAPGFRCTCSLIRRIEFERAISFA